MNRTQKYFWCLLAGFMCLAGTQQVFAQQQEISNRVVSFKKKEVNTGVLFGVNREQEELRTDETRNYEKQTLGNARFRFENRLWNLTGYKQEEFSAAVEVGGFGGFGDWIDSSRVSNVSADNNSYGLRTTVSIDYKNRFYYDAKNYSVFDVSAWGRYDVFQQNLDGTSIDSLGVSTPIDEDGIKDRFRYGFQARGGWGVGRLSPMNHLMTAHYLLETYYPGRVFSDYEIAQFAEVIARIKHERNPKAERDIEKEMALVNDFVKGTLLLADSDAMQHDWQTSEFNPRYEGKRIEAGPFFKYFNREPDFIYGGYVNFDWHTYKNVRWNQNFSVNINYNRYKKQDWMLAEVNLGWSYYSQLKSQFDFGAKYVPGIQLNGFNDVGELSHNFIPYLSYYTQLNAKSRIKVDFSYRIADGDRFVMSGPEFSLAIFRSRY